jgi:sec-independent protein translocase protein TatA
MFLIFNSIGGMELFLVLGLALIFFGAKGLPGIAKTLGKGMRQMKDAQRSIQDEIMNATGDMQGDLDDIKRNFQDNEFTRTVKDTFSEKNLRPFHPEELMKDKEVARSTSDSKETPSKETPSKEKPEENSFIDKPISETPQKPNKA